MNELEYEVRYLFKEILAALEARDAKALSECIVGLRLLVEDLGEM